VWSPSKSGFTRRYIEGTQLVIATAALLSSKERVAANHHAFTIKNSS
jgi:hypothetical protein